MGFKVFKSVAVVFSSCADMATNPLLIRYPFGPNAFSLVNSARKAWNPGILVTWAFFT